MPNNNDGRAFELELSRACKSYEARRLATIEKVEPPMRVLGGGRKVIFMRNPFLDFIGSWTELGSRAISFEAKSTAEPRLQIVTAKLTDTQIAAMARWGRSGAAAFVIWRWSGHTCMFRWDAVEAAAAMGARSLKFDDGIPVKATPRCHLDFLAAYVP